ncbi:hypothetical protein, partial [Methylobacterium radiotolerans]|uniref:hypothetical protein n=1 Tax=Methylobacterium radiotolerans TaxID=31998 RepID=UPI002F35CD26
EDIAILTKGQMIAEDLGIKLENVTLPMLGRAKRVRIEKENTTIIDGVRQGRPMHPDRTARAVSLRPWRGSRNRSPPGPA